MSQFKYNLSGKVAIVTGSSSGIGAEIAVHFAQNGARVVITGRDAANLQEVADRIREVTEGAFTPLQVVGDLTEDEFPKKLIDTTISTFKRLDILVNNAGGASKIGNFDSPTLLQEFDSCFKLNVRTVVTMTQLAVPWLAQTRGCIINISSIAGMKPSTGLLVYSASKSALDMITKCSALELGKMYKIRVNSINPGPIAASNFGRSLNMSEEEFKDWQQKTFVANSLMKRIGEVQDVANLASFLASNDAKNMTGSLCVTDSGFMVM